MTPLQVWPFLITRNQLLDYRTVTAPNFMIVNKTVNLLLRHTQNTQVGTYQKIDLRNKQLGEVTLVFQVLPAEQDGRPLTDGFGRAISIIEGFVIKGKLKATISKALWQKAHSSLRDDFDTFWRKSSVPRINHSQPLKVLERDGKIFPIIENNTKQKTHGSSIQAYARSTNRQLQIALTLALPTLLVFIAIIFLLLNQNQILKEKNEGLCVAHQTLIESIKQNDQTIPEIEKLYGDFCPDIPK